MKIFSPMLCMGLIFQHTLMSPKIENKKNYRLVESTQMEHYSLAKLYRTLHVPLFIHKLFLHSVFYFQLLFLIYFTYDVVLLFTALVLCLYFSHLCVVTGFVCFVLSAQLHLLIIRSSLNFVRGNKVGGVVGLVFP